MTRPSGPTFHHVGSIPLDEAESTLDDGCDAFVGRAVYVETHNGHGWRHRGHTLYPGYPAVPAPFHVRIARFYPFRMNPRRGFAGVVAEPGHPLDGWGFVCSTRYAGRFDFGDRPTNYNLLVCPGQPRAAEPTDPACNAHAVDLRPAGEVFSYGFGAIAETPGHLAAWEDRLRREQGGPSVGNQHRGGAARRVIVDLWTRLFRRK